MARSVLVLRKPCERATGCVAMPRWTAAAHTSRPLHVRWPVKGALSSEGASRAPRTSYLRNPSV